MSDITVAKGMIAEGHVREYSGNKILSVLMRCHDRSRLQFLEESVFSLAIQEWTDLELVVLLQNGTSEWIADVRSIIDHQPWRAAPIVVVESIEFPERFDGRSSLLNHGIARATGRFLAFLDDDDVVYQHGYATLIPKLMNEKGAAIAVGGCRLARTVCDSGNWYVRTKETPFAWGRGRLDLFRDNFIPIHSYVIDRTVVSESDLWFDDEMPPLEDYDFLLRLASKYEFDWSGLDIFVCEYRIHDANSIPYTRDATQERVAKHEGARQRIEARKQTLKCLVPLPELIALSSPPEVAVAPSIDVPAPPADPPAPRARAQMGIVRTMAFRSVSWALKRARLLLDRCENVVGSL